MKQKAQGNGLINRLKFYCCNISIFRRRLFCAALTMLRYFSLFGRNLFLVSKCRWIMVNHTHTRMHKSIADRVLLFNFSSYHKWSRRWYQIRTWHWVISIHLNLCVIYWAISTFSCRVSAPENNLREYKFKITEKSIFHSTTKRNIKSFQFSFDHKKNVPINNQQTESIVDPNELALEWHYPIHLD